MTASTQMPRAGRPLTALLAVLFGVLAASVSANVKAQVVNPGDIIVERQITPRDAFDSVPKSQDPVLVRATTFPANSFSPAMAQVVTDTDLTNAHGSSGIAGNGALGGSGMQAVTQILSGNATGNNIALGAGTIGQPSAGIGGTISSTVTGALAPLSTALGGALGGMK